MNKESKEDNDNVRQSFLNAVIKAAEEQTRKAFVDAKTLRMIENHNFIEELCEEIEGELDRAEREWRKRQDARRPL